MGVVAGFNHTQTKKNPHVEVSSVLAFSVVFLSAVMMKNFSRRHRLHRFVLGEYGWARFVIVQVRVHGLPSSFSFHMCLVSSVRLHFALLLKLALWFMYLALKDVAVSSI